MNNPQKPEDLKIYPITGRGLKIEKSKTYEVMSGTDEVTSSTALTSQASG